MQAFKITDVKRVHINYEKAKSKENGQQSTQ
jgi:hypothetical protein